VIPADYVSQCVTALQASGADNVGGVQDGYGLTTVQRAIARAAASPLGVPARFRYSTKAGPADTVYLGAYERSVFTRIGGYDPELVRNQDDELNLRLSQHGGVIWFDPAIRVAYQPRSSYRALFRQYFQYGMYKVRVMQKRSTLPSLRSLAPFAFVFALACASLAAIRTPVPLIALCAIYIFWLLASATTGPRPASLSIRLLTAPSVATMHLAYGLGAWCGIARWFPLFFRRERRSAVPVQAKRRDG
jgi:hypothetical protein